MGLPPDVIQNNTESTTTSLAATTISPDLHVKLERNPAIAYAKTLLDTGEYSFCAAMLSETSLSNPDASVETMHGPLSDLTPKAVYYRAYALYLAGERQKREEEELMERYVGTMYLIGVLLWGVRLFVLAPCCVR